MSGLESLTEYLDEAMPWRKGPWQHPISEAERLLELEGILRKDFDTRPEVRVQFVAAGLSHIGRVDLLVVPRPYEVEGLDEVVLAFEVKSKGFDLERALKQSADYVGGIVVDGPYAGRRIAASFLYPVEWDDNRDWSSGRLAGMFNLIAQWRVGRCYIDRYHELTLALGYEKIWRSRRGWVKSRAKGMLLGQRTIGGSRRDVEINVEEKVLER